MAKIVEGQSEWSAKIRCAQSVYGGGRVDGCFAPIEIGLDDIESSRDYEGDWSFWVICPSCGQKLYPRWQIGDGPLEVVKSRCNQRRQS